MTEKELKRLSRGELLELLIGQMEENEALKIELEKAREEAKSRRIAIDRAGSIAEAALSLNGVFDAAQAAAAQYLENIRQLSGEQEAVCRRMEADAGEKARAVCAQAEAYSQKVRAQADEYSQKVRAEADTYSRRMCGEADLYQKRAAERAAALFREKGVPSPPQPSQGGGRT